MENLGQRVNRVAVFLNGEGAMISLYRTNTKLGEVSNDDLGIPDFKRSNMPNKMVYMNYCRDFMIGLLESGGVEGYYYEAKQTVEDGKIKKYDRSTFIEGSYDVLIKTMDNVLNSASHIKYDIMKNDTQVEITEKYKDNYIKYAKAIFSISIESKEKCEVIVVPVYMKSGQMCKPKTIIHDGIERSLTITSINNVLRGNENPINIRDAILKKLTDNSLVVPVEVQNVNADMDADDKEDMDDQD